jgi:PAS domain S-box-containing protein
MSTTLPAPIRTELDVESRHEVQFFRDDAVLADDVVKFISAGLASQRGGIVIATAAHLSIIDARLRKHGIDVVAAVTSGQLVLAEAEATLDRFIVAGMPDRARFARVIGPIIEEMVSKFGSVRAFGEMVDVLAAKGQHAATMALEEAWSKLLHGKPVHLLCGYRLESFESDTHREPFRHICLAHEHVVPTETFTKLDPVDQLIAVASLEQKALALESEIKQRKRVETVLVRTQKDLYDFFENAPIGFHWVNAKGVIIRVNKAECELLGYQREEMVGRSVAEFHADQETVADILRRLHGGESVSNQRARLRCRDGSIKHVVIDSNALWEDERFVHTRCSTRDLTKQVEAELALQRRSNELARSNAELQQFAYVAAHDLKEPLRMVTQYMDLVSRRAGEVMDDNLRRYVGFAVNGANRMRDLIDGLLQYGKVGHSEVAIAEVDTALLLGDVLATMEPVIKEAQVVVRCDLLPTLRADRLKLRQVFENLIGNSIKYRSNAAPHIVISAHAEQHGIWRFSVIDNGIGIAAEHCGKVFDLFHRLHSASEGITGTGVGLAICKRVIEQHGGRIWAEPNEGQGTIVQFTIPQWTMGVDGGDGAR